MKPSTKIVVFLFELIYSVTGDLNVAIGKRAYQTDTRLEGGEANEAVDGDLSGDFNAGSCTHSATFDVSWEVDLGSVYSIQNVTIYNRLDCCSERLQNVQLFIGMSRDSYNLKGFHAGAVGVSYSFKFDTNVSGRWVKIGRSSAPSMILSLCEVHVFGRVISSITCNREVLRQVASGQVLTSLPSQSETHCCYMCLKAGACRAANYNEILESCSLYETVSSLADASADSVLILPQFD